LGYWLDDELPSGISYSFVWSRRLDWDIPRNSGSSDRISVAIPENYVDEKIASFCLITDQLTVKLSGRFTFGLSQNITTLSAPMFCHASIASQFLTFAIASTIILSFRLGDRNFTQQQTLSNDLLLLRSKRTLPVSFSFSINTICSVCEDSYFRSRA